jgi:hypothetical protein
MKNKNIIIETGYILPEEFKTEFELPLFAHPNLEKVKILKLPTIVNKRFDSERAKASDLVEVRVTIEKIIGEHEHKIIKTASGGTVCLVCDKTFGWWCPKSPDHLCHYFSNKGKVELIDGTVINKPKNKYTKVYTKEYETEDSCIFCGDSEERK